MELSRANGILISQYPLLVGAKRPDELFQEAKAELARFYECDEYSFWAKKEYAVSAPEVVRIIDHDGAVLAECGLGDLLADSGRCFARRGLR